MINPAPGYTENNQLHHLFTARFDKVNNNKNNNDGNKQQTTEENTKDKVSRPCPLTSKLLILYCAVILLVFFFFRRPYLEKAYVLLLFLHILVKRLLTLGSWDGLSLKNETNVFGSWGSSHFTVYLLIKRIWWKLSLRGVVSFLIEKNYSTQYSRIISSKHTLLRKLIDAGSGMLKFSFHKRLFV